MINSGKIKYWKKDWWNKNPGSELTEKRQNNYGETYYAVCALHAFKDPLAIEAIKITKNDGKTAMLYWTNQRGM